MACWLPLTGIYHLELAVGTSSQSAHSWTESKEAKKPAKKTTKKNTSMTIIWKGHYLSTDVVLRQILRIQLWWPLHHTNHISSEDTATCKYVTCR